MTSRRKRLLKYSAIASCFAAVISLAGFIWWQQRHPYGRSHCCDTQLHNLLHQYAEENDGNFPSGEATPEASLSLLFRANPEEYLANLLRGKIIPEADVKTILQRGELLTPQSCGWRYVEGLRNDDDPRLALFWDKVGLGHNGERLPEGDHIVTLIGDPHKYIPAGQWNAFLAEQRELHAERQKQ